MRRTVTLLATLAALSLLLSMTATIAFAAGPGATFKQECATHNATINDNQTKKWRDDFCTYVSRTYTQKNLAGFVGTWEDRTTIYADGRTSNVTTWIVGCTTPDYFVPPSQPESNLSFCFLP